MAVFSSDDSDDQDAAGSSSVSDTCGKGDAPGKPGRIEPTREASKHPAGGAAAAAQGINITLARCPELLHPAIMPVLGDTGSLTQLFTLRIMTAMCTCSRRASTYLATQKFCCLAALLGLRGCQILGGELPLHILAPSVGNSGPRLKGFFRPGLQNNVF